MRVFFPPPADKELRRLEAAAAARPGLYRVRLALLALTGDVFLTIVRVLPIAGPIAIGALVLNNTYIHLLAAAAIMLLIWIIRPGIRGGGESITRQDAAELYDALDTLKKVLDVDGHIDVRLVDELGASAREARGLLGIVGTRRVLTLGLPLLALLGENEARAVIAHEFGHFSRRHGRFGHWLYWAHLDWLSYTEHVDNESSIIERAGAALAKIFAPAFGRRALVWSRRCEYEADADAARAVGGEKIVNALMRLAVFEAWHANEFPRILHNWQRDQPDPPDNFLERVLDAFDNALPDLLAVLAAKELARAGDWLDTHPRLADRAAALGQQPSLTPRGPLAASVLLGSLWPITVASHNARWRKEHAVEWSTAHARYRLIEAPLVLAEPKAAVGWPIARQLDRAKTLLKFDPSRGITELALLHATAPNDRGIQFAYASARLTEDDATAIKTLIALAKADVSWRAPVAARLAHYYNRIGDRKNTNRWTAAL